jgi:cation transport protein ChaC
MYPDKPNAPFVRVSDIWRGHDLRATLAARPDAGDTWVFAYGSLLWDLGFEPAERRTASLEGFRRAFTNWTGLGRGTPERPGLGLCLEPGGGPSVGLAYRLDPARLAADLEALWRREMATAVYRAQWVWLDSAGRRLPAIAFIVDHDHPQYAGFKDEDEMATIIAAAHGSRGPCRDYLANLVGALDDLGAPEADLSRLLALVDARRGAAA